MGLEWFNENGKSGYRIHPKPTDIIYGEERYTKKFLTIKNNIMSHIRIIQLASDWEAANFSIESTNIDNYDETPNPHRVLATLEPGDTIRLEFLDPKTKITK